MIEVTIARGNFDHTTTAARTTNRASKVSTIRIIVVVATISRIEIVSTTINTIIVSVIVAAVVLTIAVVEAVAVIVVVDSFIINKASVISATDGTSGTVVLRRVIDTAIAAIHPIQ